MKANMTVHLTDLVERLQRDHHVPHSEPVSVAPQLSSEPDPYAQGVALGKRSAEAFRSALERASN